MSQEGPWPEELDALIAAPETHTLLFENNEVRVLEITIEPGQTTQLHTHRWPSTLYLLSWSDFVRRDEDGNVMLDSRSRPKRAVGTASWSPAMPPHTLENVGDRRLHLIGVELKKAGYCSSTDE
jgi:hypothetical protein